MTRQWPLLHKRCNRLHSEREENYESHSAYLAFVLPRRIFIPARGAAGTGRTRRARGRGGGPQIKAVDVHPDNTVTFHFNAPTAKEIMLVANFLPEPLALQKDEKGIFVATTKPLEPAIYHYRYTIDGVRGIDPHNPYGQRGADDATASIIEVHAATPFYFDPQPVPHGEVRTVWYESRSMGVERSFRV